MHRRVQRLLSAGALIGMLGPSLSAGRQSPYSPAERSIDELQRAMRAQQISCRTLVQYYLQRIDAYDKRGPALNAVQTINARALEEADRLDTAFRTSGPAGPLHCVPVLVKDQFDTAGLVTMEDVEK